MHFLNQQSGNYWSSTSYQGDGNHNNAWNVNFSNGNIDNNNKTNTNAVRCVRELLYLAPCFMHTNEIELSKCLFDTTEETVFTLANLWQAYKTCIKRKKKTMNKMKFEFKKEIGLLKLRDELISKKYKIRRRVYFVVIKPKPREVFAADFRDRVVHHLVYNELAPLYESWFIENSFANRPKKGTHAGLKKVREYTKQDRSAWYLKMDIESFFRSIDKKILFEIVCQFINEQNKPAWWKKDLIWICELVIFCDPTKNYIYKGDVNLQKLIPKHKSLFYSGGTGLPIGNLTSQFFANCYLDGLDKYITKTLGFTNYARYVDDFVLIHKDKEKLKKVIVQISEWLKNERKLNLHPKKIILQRVCYGIDFVGYIIKPTHTLVRQSVVKRFKNKLREIIDDEGFLPVSFIPVIHSYLGHFSHADTFRLRKKFTT